MYFSILDKVKNPQGNVLNKTVRLFFMVCIIPLILTPVLISAATQIMSADRTLEIFGAEEGDYLGRPMLCTDINNDGYDDIFVCADRSSFSGAQHPTVYVFKGSSTYAWADSIDLANETADVVIYGDTGSDNFATAMAAGDINGDGVMDFAAADSTLTVSGRSAAGAVFVLFGSTSFFNQPVYDLATGAWDIKIAGAAAYDDTGGYNAFGGLTSKGLASGDINNDGIDDLAIGAHLATANSKTTAGKVFLVWGDSALSHGTTIDLASQADCVIHGDEQYAELGTAIVCGDLNNDYIDDLILGMEYGSKGTLTTEGKVYVLCGKVLFPSSVNLLTQKADLTILGDNEWDMLGSAVTLSDGNGDGVLDLLVTASGWDHTGSSSVDEGAVYGFWGKTTFPDTINLAVSSPDLFVEGYNVQNNIGNTLEGGDFNGDGSGDFIFATRDGERPGFNAEGRTFMVLGGSAIPTTFSVQGEDMNYIINGDMNYFQLGDELAAGDVDGDGADEVLISAPFVNSATGRVLVFDLNPPAAVKNHWNLYQ